MLDPNNPYSVCDKCYCPANSCTCHINRTLFGKPIRRSTTGFFHNYPVSRQEFVNDIKNSAEGWNENLKKLDSPEESEKFAEIWAESLLAWMEIEVEPSQTSNNDSTNI